MSNTTAAPVPGRRFHLGEWGLRLLGLIILVTGLALLIGGVQLLSLGGSSYFAIAGLLLTVSGAMLLLSRSPRGGWLFLATYALTIIWALSEVGFSFWPLVSWLVAPSVLAAVLLLLWRFLASPRPRRSVLPATLAGGLVTLAVVATIAATFRPLPVVSVTAETLAPVPGRAVGEIEGTDWTNYGRTPSGTRFVPAGQITRDNVAKLDIAWTYRTGEIPKGGEGHVVTPLHVGNQLFACTQSNVLFSLDDKTGKERWRFDPKASKNIFPRCRGVSYYADPAAAPAAGADALCHARVVSTTVDARLIEVDADTGKPCSGFGDNGIVDLKTGMGQVKPGFYYQTSAPTVMGDRIIVGGWVNDNAEIEEPSGVIRAFEARTGALVWAWDLGNPANTGNAGPEGYTRGTPNVWTTPAFDQKLGLIYLPTGNSTPDFWGGHRTEAAENYTASIVALDVATGKERWKFQTMHHDLWDYDLPSQPALYDVPDGKGGFVPALIQTTKRGQIFVVNRETGVSLTKVEERPVPQTGAAADEKLAPTQLYSVGMPQIGNQTLHESDMWGATLVDQMMCRIDFKKLRYEGEFTPPGPTPALEYPGFGGGMNWGSTSIAENLGYLIVNDMRIGIVTQLVPRTEYDAAVKGGAMHGGNSAQAGTPWGLKTDRFMSALGIPCQRPPYGTVTAIDLATQKIVWQRPMGTVEDTGPLGLAMGLPIPIGLPTLGGPITTSTGLIFMAATQDKYIRALDVKTGEELWKGRLPVIGETTPVTYEADNGKQYVVVTAGGGRSTVEKGDYIIGFSLPDTK